ncbi:carbohydrate-binding protein, partial [Micromonospora sp. ATA51]|uniref:carbohydrate-binding protein n=1 Tax=Micromonospora sp. ATA51 TaxID=2806098 RepID=UPI0035CA6BFB
PPPTTSPSPTTPPPTTTAPPTGTPTAGAPAWQANTAYALGARVSYAGRTWQCRQAHTSLVGWEPPNVPPSGSPPEHRERAEHAGGRDRAGPSPPCG